MRRRPFLGAGLGPALRQPFPPSSHGAARKSPGSPRSEGTGNPAWDSGRNRRKEEAGSADGRKLSLLLLLSRSKAPGKAPAIHPPWNKARVRPADDGGRRRGGPQERRGGGGVGLFEKREAGIRESRERTRGREGEPQWKGMRNGVSHEARNGERAEEHRGVLPGLLSTNRHHSLDGGGGTYFQTCVGTGNPPPATQKLSEALGLITGARRLQGPARVGSQECSGARGWHGGGRPCSRTHSSGSAWRGGDTETKVWWTSGRPRPSSDSETGSTASSLEWSASMESSTNSSVTTRPGETESGSDTEKHDWETVEEETADTELQRQSRPEAEQERESGLEAEARSKPNKSVAGGNCGNAEGGNSSTKLHQESAKSVGAPPSSLPPRSAQDTTDEEVEEDEEVRNVLPLVSQASSSQQPARSSGVTRDLSPIIEDTEGQSEDKGEDEEARDLGNEPAD